MVLSISIYIFICSAHKTFFNVLYADPFLLNVFLAVNLNVEITIKLIRLLYLVNNFYIYWGGCKTPIINIALYSVELRFD